MFMSRVLCMALAVCLSAIAASAEDPVTQIGTPVRAEELANFFAIEPDGTGLPAGEGTAAEGREIYAQKCAQCHGEQLEGMKEIGGPALVGGRGSLASDRPIKTVESYWPYASTLYDYIWRAMPFDQPGSLSAHDVYALSAYILSFGKIIDEKQILNAKMLPKIVMPNANGFYVGSAPDLEIYRVKNAGTAPK